LLKENGFNLEKMKESFTIFDLLYKFKLNRPGSYYTGGGLRTYEGEEKMLLDFLKEKVINNEVSFIAGDNISRKIIVSDVFIENTKDHKFVIFRSFTGANFSIKIKENIVVWPSWKVRTRWFKNGKLE
jgi:hypothetical protein